MLKETKIKSLNLYNKIAIDMAYRMGATSENVQEIAGKMRLVDIAEYIKQKKEKVTR